MSAALRRWFCGTSNRTFILWPLLLLSLQALFDRGWPHLNLWGLPLLVWGYAQYRLVGSFRTAIGGGGPLGLALLLSGPAWLVFMVHLAWFDRRARNDEAHVLKLFSEPYRAYARRVKRWIPGLY